MLIWEKEGEQSLTPIEKELLMQVRLLEDDDIRRLIAQARALVDLVNQILISLLTISFREFLARQMNIDSIINTTSILFLVINTEYL